MPERFNVNLWLSLALAIPLSIIGNLITKPIQNRIASVGQARQKVKKEKLLTEFKIIQDYHKNQGDLRNYLLFTAIKVFFIWAVMDVIAQTSFSVPNFLEFSGADYETNQAFYNVPNILGHLTFVLGSLVILNICKGAIETYNRVRNFKKYEDDLQSIIGN